MKNKEGTKRNLIEYHSNGEISYNYYKSAFGFSSERTYDELGNKLTYKNSDGYSSDRTYDEQGNQLTFEIT